MNDLKIPYEINEHNLRGTAFMGMLLCIITLFTQSIIPLLVMIVDATVGLFINPQHTLLGQISYKLILPIANFRKRKISTKGKRIAMILAIMLEIVIVVLFINQQILWANILLTALMCFAIGETFFKFCTGYFIFNRLVILGILKEELCEDCVLEFNSHL